MSDLPIRCECGQLRGAAEGLRARQVTRVVCHCRDCQAFAHYLGKADRVLDAHGGTEICQVSPRTIRFESGAKGLACVRLSSKGPHRWYAKCCRSPVANTMPGFAVAGLIHPTVNPSDAELGHIRDHIFGRDAVGDRATLVAADGIPLAIMLRVLRKLLFRRIRGDHRRSPFQDPATGNAVAMPTTLTASERDALDAHRRAWRPGRR